MTSSMKRLLVAAAFTAIGGPALAGPLAISPTTIEIAPDRRSAVVEVMNASDAPVDLQFRAFAWQQENGREILVPSDDLVVSPAITTVPPRGRQVFRVLRTHRDSGAGEHSFRLKLNELPRPGTGVAVNLEFSLPVFETVKGGRPNLVWSPAGNEIEAANQGSRRIKIASLALVAPDGGRTEIAGARSSYLLSGSARRFALPEGIRVIPGSRLVGSSDAGPIDAPLFTLAAR